MAKTVVLDPGHGGRDPGASQYGLQEKDLNLALALEVAERLDGMEALLTRDCDIYLSLADRVEFSREVAPDLFLSLHVNAGGGHGFESFIYSGLQAGNPVEAMQEALHEEIMAMLSRRQIVDRGMKEAAFYVLKYNLCPAVLIESLFLDNEREARLWKDPAFVGELAGGVAAGIRAALAAAGDSSEAAPVIGPDTTLYTVQVGAFIGYDNARQRLAEAREAGFKDAFIYRKQNWR
ncbi:MAG: N-acetylmuramoyl-L-alanine amidase [Bacillota bacterium]|nr:N-acetylmuramoyl-L-alanine amidase [Bacillota bacterium]